MSDRAAQIAKLIEDAERDAYARGYADAIARITEAATAAAQPTEPARPVVARKSIGRPPTTAVTQVRELIFSRPGLKGVEIFRTLKAGDAPVLERTMRSCLARLRAGKVIWQRSGRWYPRPKEEPRAEAATTNQGEMPLATPSN